MVELGRPGVDTLPRASIPGLERRAKLYDQRRTGVQRRSKRIASRVAVLLLADLSALVAARLGAGWIVGAQDTGFVLLEGFRAAGPLASPGRPASLAFWIAMLIALFVTGAYSRHRGLNTAVRLATAALLAAVAGTLPLAAVVGLQRAAGMLSVMALVALVILIPFRIVAELFLVHVWPRERGAGAALLIGPAGAATSAIASAITGGGGDYRVASHYQVTETEVPEPEALAAAIRASLERDAVDALVVTEAIPDAHLEALVEQALSSQCIVLSPPYAVRIKGLQPRLVWHHDQPLLEFGTPVLQLSALVTKRVTDVVGASVLLLLALPLMLVIAIAVKLDGPGPLFFAQDRAGAGGRRFRMFKFRTMRPGADTEKQDLAHLNHTGDARLFKIHGDPRVTRVGALLRRWSLDEIPQFINVLRGEMSLVGPRPFFESDLRDYEDHHFRRLDTKPGITGLWQVSGRSDVVKFEDVVYLDRQYIEQWSLWLDLSILLRTVPSVIRRTGAY